MPDLDSPGDRCRSVQIWVLAVSEVGAVVGAVILIGDVLRRTVTASERRSGAQP